jgi:hypothetical protein
MRRTFAARAGGDDGPGEQRCRRGTTARGELIGKLRALFDDVKYYMSHRGDYDRAPDENPGRHVRRSRSR